VHLDRAAPRLHRLGRFLTVAGLRGDRRYWALIERRQPLPSSARLRAGHLSATFDLSDPTLGPWVYRGQYERCSLAAVAGIVRPEWVCLDVGANQGYYTMVLSSLVGPRGSVVAVEPSAYFTDRLGALATLAGNVVVVDMALGSEAGPATLLHEGDALGQSHLATHDEVPEGLRGEAVRMTTLPALIDASGIDHVDFVKIDVEGAETPVLESLLELERLPKAVLVEVWGRFATDATRRAMQAFEARGLAPHRIGRVQGRVRNHPGVRRVRPDEVGYGAEGNLLLVAPGAVRETPAGRPLLPEA